jgi:hypothetical protein
MLYFSKRNNIFFVLNTAKVFYLIPVDRTAKMFQLAAKMFQLAAKMFH